MLRRNMLTADCQNSGVKGRDLVFTLPFFQKATMKTRGLTIKISAKKLKNVGNCESSANLLHRRSPFHVLQARRTLGAYRIPLETGLLIPSDKRIIGMGHSG